MKVFGGPGLPDFQVRRQPAPAELAPVAHTLPTLCAGAQSHAPAGGGTAACGPTCMLSRDVTLRLAFTFCGAACRPTRRCRQLPRTQRHARSGSHLPPWALSWADATHMWPAAAPVLHRSPLLCPRSLSLPSPAPNPPAAAGGPDSCTNGAGAAGCGERLLCTAPKHHGNWRRVADGGAWAAAGRGGTGGAPLAAIRMGAPWGGSGTTHPCPSPGSLLVLLCRTNGTTTLVRRSTCCAGLHHDHGPGGLPPLVLLRLMPAALVRPLHADAKRVSSVIDQFMRECARLHVLV